jgi:hypothetical protein
MKTNFISLFEKTLCRILIIIGLLFTLAACIKQKTVTPEFTMSTPGGQITESWNDTLPKVVLYYDIDEKGNRKDEPVGVAEYYQNQQEYISGGLKEGKREGKWFAFFPDGSVQTEAFYVNGKEHGEYNVFRQNGHPVYKGHYNLGICDGTWTWFDENGNQTKKIKTDINTIGCGWCERCMKLKKR